MSNLRQIFLEKYEHEDKPLPNHKPRPGGTDGIIIHSMGQQIENRGHAWEFLKEIGLSAHYLIELDGKVIECVDPTRQAYHAGKSKLGQQTGLNSSFIGIEVLVEGEHNYSSFLQAIQKDIFTTSQYDSTATLCAVLATDYDIPMSRIVRHSDVSGPDVRNDAKKDPGPGFDWQFFTILTEQLTDQLKAAKNE